MKIRILDITEDDVVSASALLDESGFHYDEDYTTLYGAQWAIVGLEFTSAAAAALVVNRFAEDEAEFAVADYSSSGWQIRDENYDAARDEPGGEDEAPRVVVIR